MRLTSSMILAGLVSGTMAQAQDWPGPALLKASIEDLMPEGFDVTGVEIRAEENIGSAVMPVIAQRLVVETVTTSDMVEPVTEVRGQSIYETVAPAGTTVTLYGLAQSELVREAWETSYAWQNPDELTSLGVAVSAMPGIIMQGSAEHGALLDLIDADLDAVASRMEGIWGGPMNCISYVVVQLEISDSAEPGQLLGKLSYTTPVGDYRESLMLIEVQNTEGAFIGKATGWGPRDSGEPPSRPRDFGGQFNGDHLRGTFSGEDDCITTTLRRR